VTTCGTWLAERGARDWCEHLWPDDLEWVLGWVSAAGYYNGQRGLRHTDHDAVSAWLDNYCREHPLNELYEAAAVLVYELSKTK
jgi:hypothetical protein